MQYVLLGLRVLSSCKTRRAFLYSGLAHLGNKALLVAWIRYEIVPSEGWTPLNRT